jgi:hypothetical protein
VTRPCVMTSIVDVVGRPDLLDRVIAVETMEPTLRSPDLALRRAVRAAAPLVLGSLLDAAAAGLRHRAGLDNPGGDLRLVDFVQWVRAGAHTLGMDSADAVDAYRVNRSQAIASAAEGSLLASELAALAERQGGWTGSLVQMLDTLNHKVTRDARPRGWPESGKALSNAIRRLRPALLTVHGVEVLHDATSHKGRVWYVRVATHGGGASGAHGGAWGRVGDVEAPPEIVNDSE